MGRGFCLRVWFGFVMAASLSVMLTSPVAAPETTIFMPELLRGLSHWVVSRKMFDMLLNLLKISLIKGLHTLVYSSVKTVAMYAMNFVAITCKCSVEQTHFLRLSVCLSLPLSLFRPDITVPVDWA